MVRKLVNPQLIVLLLMVGLYVVVKHLLSLSGVLFLGGLVIGWLFVEGEKRVMVLLGEQTTHQMLFTPMVLAIFFFFSLFLLVTSLSPIAHGIVLGFGLHVCMAAFALLKKPAQLQSTFFWQIDDIAQRQMRWIVVVYISLFFLLVAIS